MDETKLNELAEVNRTGEIILYQPDEKIRTGSRKKLHNSRNITTFVTLDTNAL